MYRTTGQRGSDAEFIVIEVRENDTEIRGLQKKSEDRNIITVLWNFIRRIAEN